MGASDGRLDVERGTGGGAAARVRPTRRAVIGGGAAAGALAWVAPTIVSVPAASAATIPPTLPIDDFTDVQAANTTLNSSGLTAFPLGSRTLSSTAGTPLVVAGGLASYSGDGGPPGSQGELRYRFDTNGGVSIDLSGITSIGGPASAPAGSPSLVLQIVDLNNDSVSLAPTTTAPVLEVPLGTPAIDLTQVISLALRFNGPFDYELSDLLGT
jgi:hypothetical protein